MKCGCFLFVRKKSHLTKWPKNAKKNWAWWMNFCLNAKYLCQDWLFFLGQLTTKGSFHRMTSTDDPHLSTFKGPILDHVWWKLLRFNSMEVPFAGHGTFEEQLVDELLNNWYELVTIVGGFVFLKYVFQLVCCSKPVFEVTKLFVWDSW